MDPRSEHFRQDSVSPALLVQSALQQLASGELNAVAWRWNLDADQFDCPAAFLKWFDTLAMADRHPLLLEAEQAYETQTALDETFMGHADGVPVRFHLLGSRCDDEAQPGRVLTGVIWLEGASGNLFKLLLDGIDTLVYIKDLAGRYLYANKAFLSATTTHFAQLAGKSHRELGVGANAALARFELWLLELDDTVALEESLPLCISPLANIYQSTRFPLRDEHGRLCALGGTLTDLTANKIAQEKFAHQARQTKQFMDATQIQIWYLKPNGDIRYVNRRVRNVLNFTNEQLAGKTLPIAIPDWEGARDIHQKIVDVGASGVAVQNILSSYARNNLQYWAKIDLFPILNTHGLVEDVIMMVTDISKVRRNEELLADTAALNRAVMANSFDAIFSLAFDPPMPMALDAAARIAWMFDCGKISSCNEQFLDQELVTQVQVSGTHFLPERRQDPALVQMFAHAAQHNFEFENHEIHIDHKNGGQWWEYSVRGLIKGHSLHSLWATRRDITRVKQESLASKLNEARYRSFIANSHEGIFHSQLRQPLPINTPDGLMAELIASDLIITEHNDEFLKHWRVAPVASVVGRRLVDIEPTGMIEVINKFVQRDFQLARYLLRLPVANGPDHWLSISIVGAIENGCLVSCWGTQRDVSERYQHLHEMEHQAMHDRLTQLPNRQKLYQELELCLTELPAQTTAALLLLDLDRFKEINDTLGHHIGDMLLKQIAPRLVYCAAQYHGLVARLGGDEFAIWLPAVDEKGANKVADELLRVLNQPFDLNGFNAEISGSIGIALAPKHGKVVSDLMRCAEIAMYYAKQATINVVAYTAEFDRYTHKRLSLLTDLGRAIRENQLCLHYQPKIDVSGGFVRGFEALLRWNHPEHGFLYPGEFIELAETTEYIRPLTLWVLDAALAQCRAWRDKKLDVKVAVNLSARNLLDESIVAQVQGALQKYEIPAKSLELEITESAIMLDPKRAAAAMTAIGALGVSLSIDDYGTGYSSLAYLKRLPVDALKIDSSFVRELLEQEQDSIIVSSTINLAHNLGLKVVAEGVESLEVLQALNKMGCDLAQGYYVARPMPPDAVEGWLKGGGWSSLHIV